MGVRGLQTFLERFCPSACYTVKIIEKALEFKRATGKDPVMVIDAQSCYSLWCKGLDWVIGFEIQTFLYRLSSFVQGFKNIGIKIVFFFGGLTVPKKREAWINRRLKNLRDVFSVFDFLEQGNLTKDIPEKLESLPPTMGIFTSFLLKYVLGCEVYMSVNECDEEIIEYAEKNDCFAIFAQDSDFIISDIKSCVLSSKHFDVKTMTTSIYDRQILADILKIKVSQLPLLGILAGNDFIDSEAIKGFHCKICGISFEQNVQFDMLFPAIGKYINKLSSLPADKLLEKICYDLFGSKSSFELVKTSYDGYFVKDFPKTINPLTTWERILQVARYRHRNVIAPNTLWGIMNDLTFEFSVAFEDLRLVTNPNRVYTYMPSSSVLRPLRQRIYGILLYEFDKKPVFVDEWCGDNKNSYRKPVSTEAIIPTVHHPGLLMLWSDNNSTRLNDIKWKLFLNSISPNIKNYREWYSLTEDLVGITASLFYLFEQAFFSGYEMFAVMATVATFPLFSREKLNEIVYGKPHLRSTHISVCVTRTFSIVLTLMAACGYPVPVCAELVFLKFEAKLFQIKYKEMKQKKTWQELCENDQRCIDVFKQMQTILRKAIRKGSMKDKS